MLGDRAFRFWQRFAKALCTAFFGLRVEGAANVPLNGPLLLACNHISELDPPVLGCAVPRPIYFLAKKELFRGSFWRSFFESLHAIPVDRGGMDREALRSASDLLTAGNAIVIFPEGTRSTDGGMLPPKPGLGFLATSTRTAILPAHISGTDSIKAAVLRRPGFRVRFGEVIPAPDSAPGSGGSKRENYSRVSSQAMEAIAALGDPEGRRPARERKG
jgi:1-acyl-sn-glycerol-3-phosphate acyltransferase